MASCLLISDTNTELSYILPSEAVKKGCFERLFQVPEPPTTLLPVLLTVQGWGITMKGQDKLRWAWHLMRLKGGQMCMWAHVELVPEGQDTALGLFQPCQRAANSKWYGAVVLPGTSTHWMSV